MKALPYPDRFHLHAAEGWLVFKNHAEAALELRQISRQWILHPDVLQASCRIQMAQKNWQAALLASDRQVLVAPDRPQGWINRAFCLHELKRTRDAFHSLLPAARRFPGHDLITFNLACYCCHLREYPQALRWINRTLALVRSDSEVRSV
jgi:tetratricopeptide (TPR) repeat protein